jgi:general secretion pathway protein A
MYYTYWGLQKPPFDNVPDPSMYVESHASVENAVAETLFAIEEGGDCIAVIVGEIGSGKTLSLRIILDALDPDKYRIAFITNPSTSFVQILKDIIGQLTGRVCEASRKADLLEIFNKLLFQTSDEGRKVLILIDEANVLTPTDLESLRLLTNMQDDTRNLFTLVLSGQMELAKRLEHPRRANLFQRIGAYNRVEKIESVAVLKDYVQTRLRLAGGKEMVFTDPAFPALWEQSDHGVPRLVNKICKLSMKAGETNGLHLIDDHLIDHIGERFRRLAGPALHAAGPPAEEAPEAAPLNETPVSGSLPADPEPPTEERARPGQRLSGAEAPEHGEPSEAPAGEEADARGGGEAAEPGETSWETDIGQTRIRIGIPADVLQRACMYTPEARVKIAGTLAAQNLKRCEGLAPSTSRDPVALWSDIRRSILTAFEHHSKAALQ